MATYNIQKSICDHFNLSFSIIEELSDQHLSTVEEGDSNYRTYGGGASGIKNGMYGKRHTEDTKQKMRLKATGRIPFNKGKPNDIAKKRMLENNPMKNPEIAKKVSNSLKESYKHRKHPLYIEETRTFNCLSCGKEHTVKNFRKNKTRRFCDRSCQATFTNKNRRGIKYHAISQTPELQASS